MKTTIYELLGMIKDGKAPYKILFKGDEYIYEKYTKDYYNEIEDYLFDSYDILTILNDEVEILETTITYKSDKIEKLGFENCTTPKSANENEAFLMTCINFASMKIDEIIDHINSR